MSIIIKKLCVDDYDNFLNLINQFKPTFFTKEDFIVLLRELSNNSDIWIIVDVTNNKFIATGTILYEKKFIHNLSKAAHIEDICVDSNQRGKGYGKILISHLVDQAKQHNCYKVILDCDINLNKFYESCGFINNGLQMTIKF